MYIYYVIVSTLPVHISNITQKTCKELQAHKIFHYKTLEFYPNLMTIYFFCTIWADILFEDSFFFQDCRIWKGCSFRNYPHSVQNCSLNARAYCHSTLLLQIHRSIEVHCTSKIKYIHCKCVQWEYNLNTIQLSVCNRLFII